ncbi:hypothetical protein AAFX24_27530 [Vibrio mediterranei]|uniref:hypothetical protein n=1 Tax=Vibrio mediterranei TaxID=689 RepID=UPI0038CE08F9
MSMIKALLSLLLASTSLVLLNYQSESKHKVTLYVFMTRVIYTVIPATLLVVGIFGLPYLLFVNMHIYGVGQWELHTVLTILAFTLCSVIVIAARRFKQNVAVFHA